MLIKFLNTFVAILLFLKLWEMALILWLVNKHGSSYRALAKRIAEWRRGGSEEEFDEIVEERRAMWSPKEWPISRFFTFVPSLLKVDDLKDVNRFLNQFTEVKEPLSKYLFSQLSPALQHEIKEYKGLNSSSERLPYRLVKELNQLIRRELLYEKQRFEAIALTSETRKKVRQILRGQHLAHLNRLLLEEAYPDAINRCCESRICKFFAIWLFRYPSLMLLQTWVALWETKYWSGENFHNLNDKYFLISHLILLFVGVWLEIWLTLLSRFTMGHLDSLFTRTISFLADPPSSEEIRPLRRDLVIKFSKHFAWILLVMVVSYTALYTGINALYDSHSSFPNPAFQGLSEGGAVPFDLLYFTIITVSTVGFGDISPIAGHLTARLAVASQTLAGISLFVFFVTIVTATLDPDEDFEPQLEHLPDQKQRGDNAIQP